MIYLDPDTGPAEVDLLALELRRPDDADIAELLAAIRWMRDGGGPLTAKLKEELEDLQGECDDLAAEIRGLKNKVDDAEDSRDEYRRSLREIHKIAGAVATDDLVGLRKAVARTREIAEAALPAKAPETGIAKVLAKKGAR